MGDRGEQVQSSRNFLDVYDDLNAAHKRGELDEDKAKDTVYTDNSLLSTWLRALKRG